jgi:hypothetical protein
MSLNVTQLVGFGGKRAAAAGGFAGGNVSYSSIKVMCEDMVTAAAASPTAGGTLTINSQSLGSYDYTIKSGAQTISSFLNSDWFTTTADSRSAFIVVNGNLTINSGQTLIPSNRKLFTVIYVAGNLAVSGGISMSARGANHSAGGGNVTAAAVRIATGTFSGVTDPEVPAAGGGGAATNSGAGDANGAAGTAGSAGGVGGGGAGGRRNSIAGGGGAAGTAFSGGPGGGGGQSGGSAGGAGSANGAAGGAASATAATGGGAGNPGGAGAAGGSAGTDGTGGVLIIICTGTLSGAGTISANGSAGGTGTGPGSGGGGSGGGSVTILYGVDSGPTPTATGGTAGTGSAGSDGGAGGAGTARKLAL